MTENVAAVVVTYNRKILLVECLAALLAQTVPLSRIYVIDNASTDGTGTLLQDKGLLDRDVVRYVRMEVNGGGSGGFYAGMELAFSDGWEWIWVMDDDAIARPDALAQLFAPDVAADDVVARACRVIDADGLVQIEHRGYFDSKRYQIPLSDDEYERPVVTIDYASFVGLAVRREAMQSVGLPKREFFIANDDLEYTLRLRHAGRTVVVRDSVIVHKDGRARDQVDSLTTSIPLATYWKTLCALRNREYVIKHYGHWSWPGFLYRAARRFIRIVLFESDKRLKLRWSFVYLVQAVRGTFKTVTPGEWGKIISRP